MYDIYSTDTVASHKIKANDLRTFLEKLESQGAVFSLDEDKDIIYSFEGKFESTAIDELLTTAKNHKRNY